MDTKCSVQLIQNGSVIDHIPAGNGFKIIELLRLQEQKDTLLLGTYLNSCTFGKKDLIKVQNREFTYEETQRIAVLAPQATINIVRNSEVVEKFKVTFPGAIENIVECRNGKCITHVEKVASFHFVTRFQRETFLKCKYCEHSFRFKEGGV